MQIVDKWFRRFLWLMACYAFLKIGFSLVDLVAHPFSDSYQPGMGAQNFLRYLYPLGGLANLAVGLLVLRRARANIIAAMMIIWAGYGISFGISKDSSPAAVLLSSFPFAIEWSAIVLLFVYYPDGQAVPRRASVLYALMGSLLPVSVGLISIMGMPTLPLTGSPPNPIWIQSADEIYKFVWRAYIIGSLPIIVIIIAAPFLRYRVANHQQRQQLKYLALIAAVVMLPYLVIYLVYALSYPDPDLAPAELLLLLRSVQFVLSLIPAVVVGNAILLHRLYDIDIIIRRTLIYSVLTTILAIIYFGAIILTQQLFRAATGEVPDIAIVVSTLLIAALFSPIRRRVQNLIDSRLYRRKYDVEKTLAAFQQNLRDEVDMETLQANLIGVVSDTMQPNRIALWIPNAIHKADRL